jgi:hypothetical protein
MSDDFQNKPRHVYMGLGHILAELERNKTKIKVRGGWWMWTIYEYVSSEYMFPHQIFRFQIFSDLRNSKNSWSCMRINYVHLDLLSQFGPVYFDEHRQS